MLSELLSSNVTVRRDGNTQSMPRLSALFEKAYTEAMNGSPRDRESFLNLLNRTGMLIEKEVVAEQKSGVLMIPAAPETKQQWEAWAEMQQAPHRGNASRDSYSNQIAAGKAKHKIRDNGEAATEETSRDP